MMMATVELDLAEILLQVHQRVDLQRRSCQLVCRHMVRRSIHKDS